MKNVETLQDKLTKQNEITRRKLARELTQLQRIKKSDLKMIESAENRFRTRYKKLETLRQNAPGSDAVNVRMYETHNPGFCYHCTGAIKESGPTIAENTVKDCYELIRSLLFTNDEVDINKLLCLHILAAHTSKFNGNNDDDVKPVASLLANAKKKEPFTGAWSNVLPCYVIDIRNPASDSANVKLHEDPLKISLEEEAMRQFEERYKRYVNENIEFDAGKSKQSRLGPSNLGKMPIISPHVYSLLGASHEQRMKQAAMQTTGRRRKFMGSNTDLNVVGEEASSLLSVDNPNLSGNYSKSQSTHQPFNLNQGITMLKLKHNKIMESRLSRLRNCSNGSNEVITGKTSFRVMKEASSRSLSLKSASCSQSGNVSATISCISDSCGPSTETKSSGKRIYLNFPRRCIEFRGKNSRIVPILVNIQIEALVHSVLEVLGRVCPEKLGKIIKLAKDPEQVTKVLIRAESQSFIQSLLGQSFVSSPDSFVVSVAAVADEIDLKFEGILEKEVVALTLEMPPIPCLESLLMEIRSNIFANGIEKNLRKADKNEKGSNIQQEIVCPDFCTDNELEINYMLYDSNLLQLNRGKHQGKEKATYTYEIPRNRCNQIERTIKDNTIEFKSCAKETSKAEESLNFERNSSSSGCNMRYADSRLCPKPWKTSRDIDYVDGDSLILKRMTNNQRILIGQICASLKAKQINIQGLIDERMPLAALIASTLSRDAIKTLTHGTTYSKSEIQHFHTVDKENEDFVMPDKLTGLLLAKIRQDVAEEETKRRLSAFLTAKK